MTDEGRDNTDRSPANLKAAEAAADAAVAPIKRGLAMLTAGTICVHLYAADEDLEDSIANGSLTREHLADIDVALEQFQKTRRAAEWWISK